MTDSSKLLNAILLQSKIDAGEWGAALGVLKMMVRHHPDDLQIREARDKLAAKLADGPAVVRMERASSAGRCLRQFVGNIYVEEPDGRLRPASGDDRRLAEERFPGLVKGWVLDEDR